MAPRDALMNEEIGRFAEEVIETIARHGQLSLVEAKERYDRSIIPGGLAEAPDYYLHESPFYWAMYILTGDPAVGQDPSVLSKADTQPLGSGAFLTWEEVQRLIHTTARPRRSINWKGQAECPEAAWIITTLDGPDNKLDRPDRLSGKYFLLSDEKVGRATKRMLSSQCGFPLHIFRRIPGKPVRYLYLGLGTVREYDDGRPYPHWKIELRPVNPLDGRRLGS